MKRRHFFSLQKQHKNGKTGLRLPSFVVYSRILHPSTVHVKTCEKAEGETQAFQTKREEKGMGKAVQPRGNYVQLLLVGKWENSSGHYSSLSLAHKHFLSHFPYLY